jgi:hypothetical protein
MRVTTAELGWSTNSGFEVLTTNETVAYRTLIQEKFGVLCPSPTVVGICQCDEIKKVNMRDQNELIRKVAVISNRNICSDNKIDCKYSPYKLTKILYGFYGVFKLLESIGNYPHTFCWEQTRHKLRPPLKPNIFF